MHGTSTAVEDLIKNLSGLELFHKSKCYKQILPKSNFIKELNSCDRFLFNIEFYSIWTRGDFAVTPTHTAVWILPIIILLINSMCII